MASDRILFNAGAKVRVIRGKGKPLSKGNLLAIFIKEVRVDPRAFRSTDFGPNREGALELTVATEKTVIPFSGSGPINEKYLRKIAYLGRNPGGIGVSVGVLESDEGSLAGSWTKPPTWPRHCRAHCLEPRPAGD
jgi:hypothetical protein